MFKYFNKWLLSLTVIASCLNSFVFLIDPLITSKIFDLTAINSKQDIWGFLWYGLTLYGILYTVMFLANLLINHILTIGCGKIRLQLYQNLILGHHDTSNEKKISILTQDFEYYVQNHILPSILLVADVSDLLILSAYLLSKNTPIGLIFIACSLIFLLAQHFLSQKAEQNGNKQTLERQKLLGMVSDTITGQSTLIQNQAIRSVLDQVQNQSQNYEKARLSFEISRALFDFIGKLMLFISQILPLFLGLALMASGVNLATTDLIAMFIASTRLNQPLMSLVGNIFKLKGAKSIAQNVDQILSQQALDHQVSRVSKEHCQALECQNLTKSFADRRLFTDFSFRFDAGKKYLIKGPSGSGKSTLFKVILQELEADKGSIHVVLDNGQRSSDYSHHIGLIAQSPYLFNDSIRYNLTLGETFSDQVLVDKLQAVGLTDEFEDILNYQITNNGDNISGGQRVRLDIARNLIRQKTILLADEVTAPLDDHNAKAIRNLLFHLPVTLIEIAHHIDEDFEYETVIDLSLI